MRELNIGTKRHTKIIAFDEPGPGRACHNYEIIPGDEVKTDRTAPYLLIQFQKGPIKETGPNGIFIEDLIAICIDRLEGFQSGDFNSTWNSLALINLRNALLMLNKRTEDRIERGVEGKSEL